MCGGKRALEVTNLFRWLAALSVFVPWGVDAIAHNDTFVAAAASVAEANASPEDDAFGGDLERSCTLEVHLRDAKSRESLYGLVRITPLDGRSAPLKLDGLPQRPAGWYSMPPDAEIRVPPGKLRVEAVHGIETAIAIEEVDLTEGVDRSVRLALSRIYDAGSAHLYAANTHLHLMLENQRQIGALLRTRQDADQYLKAVGGSDGLDLVYVSRLTRPGQAYISNDYTAGDLSRLSDGPTLFGNGIEHRHGRTLSPSLGGTLIDGQMMVIGYGHALLLHLENRSIAASIGPGLTDGADPTDATPLRRGMIDAREQGGGVIWCHGRQGLEDVADWVAGLVDAQNIYDGGNEGTFDTVFYPYLNAGFKVPFSTGTDWGVFDFSRVYVSIPGAKGSGAFLHELREGRSYITNEPFLEFSVDGLVAGDTVTRAQPGSLPIRGRVVCRSNFVRVQVVYNGEVVHEAASRFVNDRYEANVDFDLTVVESGWVAMRITPVKEYASYDVNLPGPGMNLFGKPIFAHTSPVYLSVAGRPTFDPAALADLISQVRIAGKAVGQLGSFANRDEREGVLRIYREAEVSLQELLESKGRR